MNYKKFEELPCWQMARELCKAVFHIVNKGKFQKDFSFKDQVWRASGSVMDNIAEGFDETEAQSLFLDLPNPENYIPQSREALLNGGCFGSILPTTNQVSNLITALKKHNFGFIEISEILHRYYKTTATRFRPTDRMVAHTGYLIFARKLASMKDVDA